MEADVGRQFVRKGHFFVYILECSDGTYYTGYTNDLRRRLRQHNTGRGGARYTQWKGFGALVWCKEYRRFKAAYSMEKRIKTLTRLQKEWLVKGKRVEQVLKDAGK